MLSACQQSDVAVVDTPRDALGVSFQALTDVAQARDSALRVGIITQAEADKVTAGLTDAFDRLSAASVAIQRGEQAGYTQNMAAASALIDQLQTELIKARQRRAN